MQIGAGTSPMSSYVAFTRVSKKEDLLIFRPFDRKLFNQGNQEGPDLLLRVLRGEVIDWEAIEAKHMPSYMCCGCETKQFKFEFSEQQLQRREGQRFCKPCEKILSCNGDRKQCCKCDEWKTEDRFEAKMWRPHFCKKRCCLQCAEVRECSGCGENKPKELFDDPEWQRAGWKQLKGRKGNTRGRCRVCTTEKPMLQLCTGPCGEMLPEYCFSANMWKKMAASKVKCKECCKGGQQQEDVCKECDKSYPRSHFSDWQWNHVGRSKRKCVACCTGPNTPETKGQWTCVNYSCRKTLPLTFFRRWMEEKKKNRQDNTQVCNECFVNRRWAQQEIDMQRASSFAEEPSKRRRK